MAGQTDNLDLALRIRADLAEARQQLRAAERDVIEFGTAGDKSQRKLAGFTRQVDRADRASRGFADSAGRIKGALAGLAGVASFTAIARGAVAAAQNVEDLRRQALALGQSTQSVQRLNFVFRQFGLDLADVSDALTTLADRALDAQQGTQSFIQDFELLGVSVDDLRGKNPTELFTLLARRIGAIDDPTRRATGAVRIFGDDLGRRLLPLLVQGGDKLEHLKDRADDLNIVLADDTVDATAAASRQFRTLKEIFSAQFTRAVAESADDFSALTAELTDPQFLAGLKTAVGLFTDLTGAVTDAIQQVGTLQQDIARGDIAGFFQDAATAIYTRTGIYQAQDLLGYGFDDNKSATDQLDADLADTEDQIDIVQTKLQNLGNIRTVTPDQAAGQAARQRELENRLAELRAQKTALTGRRERAAKFGGGYLDSVGRTAGADHSAGGGSDGGGGGRDTDPNGGQGGNPPTGPDKIQRVIDRLREQAATYGQTAAEARLYRLRQLGASEATIAQAKALNRSIAQQKADAEQRQQTTRQTQQAADAQARFVARIKAQIDPARQYRQELQRLNQAYANGANLSAPEYAQAVDALHDKIDQAKQSAEDGTDAVNQFAVQAARNIQNTLADAFQFNKLENGFQGLVHSAAQAFEQIAAQALAVQLSNKLFGDGFAQGQSSDVGGLFGKLGDLFGGGDKTAAAGSAKPAGGGGADFSQYASLITGGSRAGGPAAEQSVARQASDFASQVFSDRAAQTASQSATQSAGGFADKLFGQLGDLFASSGSGAGAGGAGGAAGGAGLAGAIYAGGSAIGGGLAKLFGGDPQKGAQFGGLLGGLPGLAASFFHAGGLVAPGAGVQRPVALGAFAGAPRLHAGESIGLKPDEVPAVLRTGERVQSRAEVAASRGGGPHTIKNVLVDDQRRVTEHLAGPEGEQIVLQHVQRNADQVAQVVKGGN